MHEPKSQEQLFLFLCTPHSEDGWDFDQSLSCDGERTIKVLMCAN